MLHGWRTALALGLATAALAQGSLTDAQERVATHRRAIDELSAQAARRYQDFLSRRQDYLTRRGERLADRTRAYEDLRGEMADLSRRMNATTYADDRARLLAQFEATRARRTTFKQDALDELSRMDADERSDEEALARDVQQLVEQLEAERLSYVQALRDYQARQSELTRQTPET